MTRKFDGIGNAHGLGMRAAIAPLLLLVSSGCAPPDLVPVESDPVTAGSDLQGDRCYEPGIGTYSDRHPCVCSRDGHWECMQLQLGSRAAAELLVVIDNSASMGTRRQSKVAEGLGDLVERLLRERPGLDLRVGVTTTDDGNCGGASGGKLQLTSCGEHREDFGPRDDLVEAGFASPEDCPADCPDEAWPTEPVSLFPEARRVPWLQLQGDATNLGPDVDALAALNCIARPGVGGCAYEEPLEAMRKAVLRSFADDEASFGFLRPGTADGIVIVTDEPDCSLRSKTSVLDPEGPRALWSDPEAPAATSAACFNAGVACQGDGEPWLRCDGADIDEDGNPTTPDDAVMLPADHYAALLDDLNRSGSLTFAVIGGVAPGQPPDDVAIVYEQPDGVDFGTAPGCEDDSGPAYPPIRLRELAAPGLYSICEPDYGEAFADIGDRMLADIPATCGLGCVSDRDPGRPGLQPDCFAFEVGVGPGREAFVAPPCDRLEGERGTCLRFRSDATPDPDDDPAATCIDEGRAFDWELVVDPGSPDALRDLVVWCAAEPPCGC